MLPSSPHKAMGHLDSLRILHRMEGRQFPQGNELTCLGPFHRKLEGIESPWLSWRPKSWRIKS